MSEVIEEEQLIEEEDNDNELKLQKPKRTLNEERNCQN